MADTLTIPDAETLVSDALVRANTAPDNARYVASALVRA